MAVLMPEEGLMARLERLYNFNADLLRDALRIIVDSWSGHPDSLRPEIVEGVALYLLDHVTDPRELVETLAALRCGPMGLIDAARENFDAQLAVAVADQIAAIHR